MGAVRSACSAPFVCLGCGNGRWRKGQWMLWEDALGSAASKDKECVEWEVGVSRGLNWGWGFGPITLGGGAAVATGFKARLVPLQTGFRLIPP